ncbi:MAG: phosphoribosyltransferase [Bacteroidota bacterium]
MRLENRRTAGRELAEKLAHYAGRDDVVVLALPRGGVPVAFEVARALDAPLDVFVVRKLGVPGHDELAMGAIAAGGVSVLSEDLIRELGVTRREVSDAIMREQGELDRREHAYRAGPPADVRGKTVVLVDDGFATGSTMRAAIVALRRLGAACIVAAAPVGARETCDALSAHADEVVCAHRPAPFVGVGEWYDDFDQTTDEEVRALLSAGSVRVHG